MLCPRCGNEWDASRSSCSNCGFKVRAANPTASSTSFAGQAQRGGVSQGQAFAPGQQSDNGSMTRQQRGNTPAVGPTVSTPNLSPAPPLISGSNWPTSKQNSGSLPTGKKQTNGPAPANDVTMRPAFEKQALRKAFPTRDAEMGQINTQQLFPNNGTASTFGTTQQGRPRPIGQPPADNFQQNMPRAQAQPMTQRRLAPNDAGSNMRGAPTRQSTGPNAQPKSTSQSL